MSITPPIAIGYHPRPHNDPLSPGQEEQRRELVLASEGLVLATLGFEFNVEHPYKPLVAEMKRLGVSAHVAQVAWNFVNDG